jgi:hypothetical protein
MASYLLKLSVCYFNSPLLKINFNTIGDNSASHNIQQVMIYNTLIRLKYIYNFLCSMLVLTPFALCFVTLHGVFMHFLELTY